MGVGSITAASSMSVMQMTPADLKDQKSKNIQNEITDAQQQMQKLSSDEELSVKEQADEKKKLQREISSLNTELKQHQEELLRSQKRERMLAELREEASPAQETEPEATARSDERDSDTAESKKPFSGEQQNAQPGSVITRNSDGTVILKEAVNQNTTSAVKTENSRADERKEAAVSEAETDDAENDAVTDSALPGQNMHAMVTADTSLKQAGHAGTVVIKTDDGIAILKSEIRQDKLRDADADTERKQAELERMEKQEQRAMAFRFSILGDANNAMQSALETSASAKDNTQADEETNAYINALNMSLTEQTSQPKFFVSFG